MDRNIGIAPRFLWAFALVACMSATPLLAASPTEMDKQVEALQMDVPRIHEILQIVIQQEGQPTKQLHDELWGLTLTRLHADPAMLGRSMENGAQHGLLIQRAFWESMRASAIAGKVTLTKEFVAIRDDYAAARFTADYRARQDAMLAAAATGKPYAMRDGKSKQITKADAEQVLAVISAAHSRIRKLTNPDWE